MAWNPQIIKPTQNNEGRVQHDFMQHFSASLIQLTGYGSLVAFSWFLTFAAQRYHSVYGWAHQFGQNTSPELYFQSAQNMNKAILPIVAVAIFLTIRNQYLLGRIIGGICVLTCLALFVHCSGHVGVRF